MLQGNFCGIYVTHDINCMLEYKLHIFLKKVDLYGAYIFAYSYNAGHSYGGYWWRYICSSQRKVGRGL